jgi:hypothetical protein
MPKRKVRKPTPVEVGIKELLEWIKELPPEIRTQNYVLEVRDGLEILEKMYYIFDGNRFTSGVDTDIVTMSHHRVLGVAASHSDYETVRALDQRLSDLLRKIESL